MFYTTSLNVRIKKQILISFIRKLYFNTWSNIFYTFSFQVFGLPDDERMATITEKDLLLNPLIWHDYCLKESDKRGDLRDVRVLTKTFSKCDQCRRARTKVTAPKSLVDLKQGKNDGVTCDFCGAVMSTRSSNKKKLDQAHADAVAGLTQLGSTEKVSIPQELLQPRLRKSNLVECGICHKVVLKESLIKHIKDIHELSNKRQCPICMKVLSGQFSLKEHISAIHTKECLHKCNTCGKTFAHFSNLNRHIRLIHKKTVVAHKYVNCPLCNKIVQSSNLKKHQATIHDLRKDFKCQYCGKGFAQSYTLKEHIAAKHTRKLNHTCEFCHKSFAHKTNCNRHMKTVHHFLLCD